MFTTKLGHFYTAIKLGIICCCKYIAILYFVYIMNKRVITVYIHVLW